MASTSPIAFNKEDFNTSLSVLALVIPAKLCNDYLKLFTLVLFDRPRMKRIYNATAPDQRLLLLNEATDSLEKLPPDLLQYHQEHGSGTSPFSVSLTYEHLTVEEILKRLFAKHGVALQEIPSSYEQAGHVAHVNLREEALPYKHLIGQVILEKNRKTIRSVVNKIANIDTVYRTFPLEVLAGDGDLNVTLKESGAKFSFNFAEVYWNSRLQAEHDRLIHTIIKRSRSRYIVADMMAGIGPFAVPLAMQSTGPAASVFIHANDLNPASYKYLVENMNTNHCSRQLSAYNLDAREFVIGELIGRQRVVFHETIMNLPQNAVDFLDTFIGLAHRYRAAGLIEEVSSAVLPIINVYAFSTEEDGIADVIHRSATIMGCEDQHIKESGFCEGHIVRDVSPKKVMVCLSFRLPATVAAMDPVTFPFESRKRNATTLEA